MPEPLSIAITCTSLLNGIFTLTKNLASFVNDVKGARKDVGGFKVELSSLQVAVSRLKEDEIHIPSVVKGDVVQILQHSQSVLGDMQTVIDKHNNGGVGRKLQWALADHDEVTRLRDRLQPHTMSLQIALSAALLHRTYTIKEDTGEIKAEVALLRKAVEHFGTMLAAGKEANPMLERYLQQAAEYADSMGDPDEAIELLDEVSSVTEVEVGSTTPGKPAPNAQDGEEEDPDVWTKPTAQSTSAEHDERQPQKNPQKNQDQVRPELIHALSQSKDKPGSLVRYLSRRNWHSQARVSEIKYLLANGADINRKFVGKWEGQEDVHQGTALHIVAGKSNWVHMIPALLDAKVDIEARSARGFTALQCALQEGNREAVRVLVAGGASLRGIDVETLKERSRTQLLESLPVNGELAKRMRERSGIPAPLKEINCTERHRFSSCKKGSCPSWAKMAMRMYPQMFEESYKDLRDCLGLTEQENT